MRIDYATTVAADNRAITLLQMHQTYIQTQVALLPTSAKIEKVRRPSVSTVVSSD